ncbi:hypothetical protein [Enterococcus phage TJE1]|uniref:Phage protein n=1 Tax=Enterococcus phage TJE1 TaxID=2951262 RepID=A0A976SXM6_9CAUD|nr:hypothetical protein [Enterococcus phage TJE1]
MKYRKKPVVIEAFKFDGDFMDSTGNYYVPNWVLDTDYSFEDGELYIKTLEGWMHVSVGDYIIQGVQGEVYPCKPDIFEETYVKVMEE